MIIGLSAGGDTEEAVCLAAGGGGSAVGTWIAAQSSDQLQQHEHWMLNDSI